MTHAQSLPLVLGYSQMHTHLRTLLDGQTDRQEAETQMIPKVSLEGTASFRSAELVIHVSLLTSKVQPRDIIVLNLQGWLL